MKFKPHYLLMLAVSPFFFCKEKAAATNSPAPAAVENAIATGIYQSAKEGDCLCVNSEKKIACMTRDIEAMGISLGSDYDKSEVQDLKALLQERYRGLKIAGKDSLRDGNEPAIYVKVKQATNCMAVNKPIGGPIAYEEYCVR